MAHRKKAQKWVDAVLFFHGEAVHHASFLDLSRMKNQAAPKNKHARTMKKAKRAKVKKNNNNEK